MQPHNYAKIYEQLLQTDTSKLNADLEETTNKIEIERKKQLHDEFVHNEINALI